MNANATTTTGAATAGEDRDEPGSSSGSDSDIPEQRSATLDREIDVVAGPGLRRCPDLHWLRDRLRDAVGHIGRPVRRVTVMVVDDQRMQQLNRVHRDREGTTDVLSFHLSGPQEPIEADIAVCADEAARQAERLGLDVEQELLLYAVHGLLHGAGFDDQQPEGFRAMHAEEDRILQAIGVGPTFGRKPSGHDDGDDSNTRDQGPRA